jgi:hypothetical protein
MTTVVDYPYGGIFRPTSTEFGPLTNTEAVKSPLSGGVVTGEVPGKRWACSTVLPVARGADRAKVEGFFDSLNGQAVRVRLWHMGRLAGLHGPGTPVGTINVTGVTVKTNAAQFATSVTITGCGNAKTLEGGDMLAINGQLIMNPVLAAASAGGDLVVPVSGMLRTALTAGMPVTLIKPTAMFIMTNPDWRAAYRPGDISEEFAIDWEEVFA